MNTIEVKTPNGYTATISTELNFRQYREIKRVAISAIVIDAKTNTRRDTDASFLDDVSQKAMSMLLVKLTGPEGGDIAEPFNAIGDIPAIDGQMISDKIDEIYASISIDQKKGV